MRLLICAFVLYVCMTALTCVSMGGGGLAPVHKRCFNKLKVENAFKTRLSSSAV